MHSIALITNGAASVPNFRGSLIKALVSRGYTVYALAPDFNDQLREKVTALGAKPIDISLERTGTNPFQDFRSLVKLWLLLRRIQPDVVLSYFIKPAIYGTIAAYWARVPRRYAMIEGIGYVFVQPPVKSMKWRILKFVTEQLLRFGLRRARKILFLNNDDMSLFVERNIVHADKVVNIGGIGVDLRYFSPKKHVTNPVTFLLIARLLREKGIYEYVEAARIVKSKHPSVRFLLVGDVDTNPGSLSADEVVEWVKEGIIEWPGQVEDVRPWIAQSSVYVLPSYREGVPRSTQEAMAIGRAIITTDAVGCRETVVDSINGYLVPIGNSVALAEAMLRFVENPAFIETFGNASLDMAIQKFDDNKVNAIILRAMQLE